MIIEIDDFFHVFHGVFVVLRAIFDGFPLGNGARRCLLLHLDSHFALQGPRKVFREAGIVPTPRGRLETPSKSPLESYRTCFAPLSMRKTMEKHGKSMKIPRCRLTKHPKPTLSPLKTAPKSSFLLSLLS